MNEHVFPILTILGGGLTGLSLAYHYKGKSEIFEQESKIGGTASSETYGDFVFDHGPHLSFTKNKYVISLLNLGTRVVEKQARPINQYKGLEFPHPALFHLKRLDKVSGYNILMDLIEQYKISENKQVSNYEDWCVRTQGKYFAENFTKAYTKKFWRTDPSELSIDWVKDRIPNPSIKEAVSGTFGLEEKTGYYIDKYRYPISGGFGSFSNFWQFRKKDISIHLNSRVTSIDPSEKMIQFSSGKTIKYSRLVSTLPLPNLIAMIKGVPSRITNLSKELRHSSLHYLNIALYGRTKRKFSWVYFYDSEIPVSRLIAYNNVGNNMAPSNFSSIQIEIPYTEKYDSRDTEKAISSLENLGYINERDIHRIWEFDLRFGYPIHDLKRTIILDEIYKYLDEVGIVTAGRYGRWEHLWSHQVIIQGKEFAEFLSDPSTLSKFS
ncbi:NAD(P)-binding protein [Thermoplasmatales archaeon AK]|nr:NAD(P)-binding protein [Thermoplasmatales archaeon AK]